MQRRRRRLTEARLLACPAHSIKDRSSNTARAVFNLKSELKWSMSGTPLQNRVGELYSLIRFLEARSACAVPTPPSPLPSR